MPDAWLSLGSNMGDKRANLAAALGALERAGVAVVARSGDYRTPPWGPIAQDWFVNACAAVRTALPPRELLRLCLAVERDMGRIRAERWGPRLIDIDILAYEGAALAAPNLTLPHPRLLERAFVLVPLAEIAPDLVVGGQRIGAAAAAIDRAGVERLATGAE
ncbi:2-amino-4-hydroxy-6-hydroxymethyldihydropteridine diphosphokinase [Alsobacter sp. KACC 23698]|uniref:2-amino-4-hydroxy-6-hydroxymethyldihydropteridine pyrophosphokinase n=1 Tax=Alsobacter sp. KACC 23698 TaxID=3149229 RepID=A0AAU7JA68_9HYPH